MVRQRRTSPIPSGPLSPSSSSCNDGKMRTMMWSDAASVYSAEDSGAREVTQEEYFSTLVADGGSSSKSCAPDLFQSARKGGGLLAGSFPRRVFARGSGGGGSHRRRSRKTPRQQADWDAFSVVSDCGPRSSSSSAASAMAAIPTSSRGLSSAGPSQGFGRSSSAASVATPSSAASVCNATVASHDTVKASNKSDVPPALSSEHATSSSSSSGDRSSPAKVFRHWGKLRGFLGGGGGEGGGGRLHSVSEEHHPRPSSHAGGRRPRSHSDDRVSGGGGGRRAGGKRRGGGGGGDERGGGTGAATLDPLGRADQAKLDQSILGRYDGLVVLSLGPANLTTLESLGPDAAVGNGDNGDGDHDPPHCRPETVLPWERFPPHTFSGRSTVLSPAEVLSRALWTDAPTIVLEGFVPGEDRWSVRVEQAPPPASQSSGPSPPHRGGPLPSSAAGAPLSRQPSPYRIVPSSDNSHDGGSGGPPSITPVLTEEDANSDSNDDGGSPVLPSYHLWPTLWGSSDPAPDRADLERLTEEDPLLHLAAEHSIPIDLDENTFCVSDRAQWESVHAFLAVALGVGRFDAAILILTKLLGGMDLLVPPNDSLRFLRGAVLHNLGLVRVWQGHHELALEHFHAAVQERTKTLPKGHPDVAVSTAWKGLAQFALGRYDDALFALELALDALPGGADGATDPTPPVGGVRRHDLARAKLLSDMGVVLYQMRRYLPALRHFTSALEVQRGWLDGAIRRDAVVCDAATTLGNMGKLYLERGDGDRAYFVYEEALLLRTAVVRRDHELVWESLLGLALTRARDGQSRSALHILQGCLRSQTSRLGRDAPETVDTLGYLGYLYEHLECHEDALKCLASVKKWQKLHLPPNHPSLRKTKETVHRLEEAIGTKVSVWV